MTEATATASFASFLDIKLKFDTNRHLSARLYDKKKGDFNFAIIQTNGTHD